MYKARQIEFGGYTQVYEVFDPFGKTENIEIKIGGMKEEQARKWLKHVLNVGIELIEEEEEE